MLARGWGDRTSVLDGVIARGEAELGLGGLSWVNCRELTRADLAGGDRASVLGDGGSRG